MTLSILCVTQFEQATDDLRAEMDALAARLDAEFVEYDGTGAGSIEFVLDAAVAACTGDYVLRLDDDERCSDAMVRWLAGRNYELGGHWTFPRVHLWENEYQWIADPPLWPDPQTRLSVKAKSGGRRRVHQPSPFGPGLFAPDGVVIEHHKFLIRTELERQAILDRYEAIQAGAGSHFTAFSLPQPKDLRRYHRELVAV